MLGVLGGMGPAATLDFMARLMTATEARTDQDHIEAIVYQATTVPDRSAAILGTGADPLPALKAALRRLERAGASLIVMPCNTAHHWHGRLQAETDLPFLHIVEAVIDELGAARPAPQRLGLLATSGTVMSGEYRRRLEAAGFEMRLPSLAQQQEVMAAIGAIKAGLVEDGRKRLTPVAVDLQTQGCQAVIMACTEIPLALRGFAEDLTLIDPTDALIRAALRYGGGTEPSVESRPVVRLQA